MWSSGKSNAGKKTGVNGVVAVAIDKDKGSQYAIRWAIENLVGRSRPIVLIHVLVDPSFTEASNAIICTASPGTSPNYQHVDKQARELFLSFRCFCTRKDIRCLDVTLKDTDVAKALTEYVSYAAIENLVLGATRGGFMRKFKSDIPGNVSRSAPDFCNVYVISKTKLSMMRHATRPIEVLSCIRHPHMVLLLGACPEYGCLVYEYMANGSLDDRLFRRGKSRALCWQVRFRIAAEIATGLHFLHQTKPEPLVHRDLKPANILLDRYFVSKIGDVGLARLVPPSVADHITQYCMTSAAGTFCYIDPEYQQTGMLGVKSDVYSLGVVLLQLLTAKPPMGLAHQVDQSIENGTFREMLDPLVPDWPIEETLCLAKIAVQCAEMRRKDRPELGKEVLPELNRLRDFAEDSTPPFMFYVPADPSQE